MKKEAVLNREVKNYNESEKEKEFKIPKDKPGVINAALHFLFGLTSGLFPESYIVSPFAAAAVASSRKGFSVYTFLGAAAGFVLSRGIKGSVRYIITLCFVLAAGPVARKKFLSLDKTVLSAMFAAFFVLVSDALDMLSVRVSPGGVLLCVTDGVLCACAAYFFSRSISVSPLKTGIRKISGYDAVCIIISAACLICCVGKINIAGFYIFHVPACLLIMFCAYYGKAPGASIAGILLGLVLSFGCENGSLFYMYAAGGLFSGTFSFSGQYLCAAVFALTSCAASFIGGTAVTVIPFMAECVISALLFMIIPQRWLYNAEEYLTKSGLRNDSEINMQVALNLRNAAKTVGSISEVVSRTGEKMEGMVNPETSVIFARIQHNVCTDCEYKSICWNECFDSTVRDIQLIAKMRLNLQKVCTSDLSGGLSDRCLRVSRLSDEIDRDYKHYILSTDSRIKLDEMKSIVTDQFSSMAQMLYDVSSFVADEKAYDENKSAALKKLLRENRIAVESAAYRENSFSRATVEIAICEEAGKINSEKIGKLISRQLRKKFRDAEISVEDLRTVLTFRQKSEYRTAVGIMQIPCGDNAACGDAAQTFDASDGCTVAVISDGMGTGRRAAVDAQMTSTIMNRLLCAGFTFRSALMLVNSALLIRGGEEALSTVDALCVNTYNGKCTFYKAGAAQSYIRHGKSVSEIEMPSLPVGILRNIDFASEEAQTENGDIILLISDGVKGEDDGWIKETLLCWSTDNMQELATHIADMARMKNEKKFPDDITVIAVKIV